MATRANICLDSNHYNRIWLYHHWDGYPSGLGIKLMEFLKENGNKPNEWYNDSIWLANLLIKDKEDDGYELTNDQHGDIDYLYKIDTAEKKITVYRVGIDGDCVYLLSVDYTKEEDQNRWLGWCGEH